MLFSVFFLLLLGEVCIWINYLRDSTRDAVYSTIYISRCWRNLISGFYEIEEVLHFLVKSKLDFGLNEICFMQTSLFIYIYIYTFYLFNYLFKALTNVYKVANQKDKATLLQISLSILNRIQKYKLKFQRASWALDKRENSTVLWHFFADNTNLCIYLWQFRNISKKISISLIVLHSGEQKTVKTLRF